MQIPSARRRPAIFAGLAGCFLIGLMAALAGCHKEKPAPPIDQLTEALQHSAEKAITAPTLANEQVILNAGSGQFDSEAANILKAASAAGGAAIRSVNAQGQTSILATIPENNADAFKAAVQHEKIPMNTPSVTTTLIEVLITPSQASPTP